MLDILILLAALALLCAPGILVWSAYHPEGDRVETWTWGATAGLAAAVLLAFYVSLVRLSWFWPAWAACGLAALAAHSLHRPPARRNGERSVLLILALVATSRFLPVLFQAAPLGWDPAFHLLLARKLLLLDHSFSDWTPFAPVALNYPLGSHVLVVVLTRLTHLSLHRVFQLLMPALGVLSTAQIYCLTRALFSSDDAASYAAIAYGFWAYLGSIGYYVWGGLPNELGMAFLIAAIAILLQRDWTRISVAFCAMFLAGAVVVHHHVTLVAGLVVLIALIWRKSTGFDIRRPLAAVALLAALAAPVWLGLAARALTLAQTNVLHNKETYTLAGLTTDLGILLVAFALAGMVLLWRTQRKSAAFLPAICAMLAAGYLVCGPLYRAYSEYRFGQPFVSFAPSRFITDLAYFLSVFAGYAMWRCQTSLGLSHRKAVCAALALALTKVPQWRNLYVAGPSAGQWRAYQWIDQNTLPGAIVDNRDPWAGYVTWRQTTQPPLPDSEPVPPELTIAPGDPVYSLAAPGGRISNGQVVWTDASGWSVIDLSKRAATR
ncbi:MAG: hypothetical protein ACRD3E_08005 [Terriglobales bacterium]